jgi:hypothetical protein
MVFYPLLFGHVEGPDPSELPARPPRYQLAELQPERTAYVTLRLRQTLKRFR